MDRNDRKLWAGIALLLTAGVLLFVPLALNGFVPATAAVGQAAAGVAVLGLAGAAVLIGTAEDGRPV